MSTPTEVYLPPHLPYPVKVLSLAVSPLDAIQRGTCLLQYSFIYPGSSSDNVKETRYGSWDSTVEGDVEVWKLKPGDTVSARRAKEAPAMLVNEPCKHGVQIGGLCAMCGKDMTGQDYLGGPDMARALIQMTHSATGPTVSLEEAERIERETAGRLIQVQKLSLIVDLDQTIVHATVDPTVGEWIADGEEWERRQAVKAEAASGVEDSESEDLSSDDDAPNPNWEALKDVRRFRLGPEQLGQAGTGAVLKGKQKVIGNEGCLYYIKPRPGWRDFLAHTATKYEMHVYTMGTRAYAEEVCAVLDPDGTVFGGRILSRDESGSLTQKNLQRLFPVDTSMVVIIDDRADVWEWSPNLVKVIPYDFFVGIGDINSTYLPKVVPLVPTAASAVILSPIPVSSGQPSAAPDELATFSGSATNDVSSNTTEGDMVNEKELTATALLTQNTLELEAQMEERPLARKQEQLSEHDVKEDNDESSVSVQANPGSHAVDIPIPERSKKTSHARIALLKNDDAELERVGKILDEVHKIFFEMLDAYHTKPSVFPASPVKTSRKNLAKGPSAKLHDVGIIIPQLRLATLTGVNILFSSVIPLDTPPESTEIWRIAHAFGATCHIELSRRVTHVVAAKMGTVKVDSARKLGGIKIVWFQWLADSIALWHRQDETRYLMGDESALAQDAENASSSPLLDSAHASSDIEPDTDEWDRDDPVTGGDGEKNGNFGEGDVDLTLHEVNWDDINDEVEAAMNESDSESRSVHGSDASWSDETESMRSTNSGRVRKRKRVRSATPSETTILPESSTTSHIAPMHSPLSKRKKLSANRSGTSMLKVASSPVDVGPDENGADERAAYEAASLAEDLEDIEKYVRDSASEDGGDDDLDDLDDFLAREMEEEISS